MCEDMNVLDKNSTWKLTNLSEGNKLFERRRAFTIKYKPDSTAYTKLGYSQIHEYMGWISMKHQLQSPS